MVFANGARSHMAESLGVLSDDARDGDFFIGNMIPTCVNDDRAAAAAVNRRTLTSYAMLPNYRNYWREAGYEEEMAGVEGAIEAGDHDRVPDALYRIGLIHLELGNPDDAEQFFERVVNTWPDSDAAELARSELRDL